MGRPPSYLDFDSVLTFVKNGDTISKALKRCKIDRKRFYRNITNEQKILINGEKTANSKYHKFKIT